MKIIGLCIRMGSVFMHFKAWWVTWNFSENPCTMCSSICETCIEGQRLRAAVLNDRGMRANEPLDRAHLDVFGGRIDVTFIDDCMSSGSDLENVSKWEK